MKTKILEFKEFDHISLQTILGKYLKTQNIEDVLFTSNEFKSMLSYVFAYQFHRVRNEQIDKFFFESVKNETSGLLNSTRKFGRQLIENLDGFNKECLDDLMTKRYNIKHFFINKEIVNFIQEALLDYMTIRSFEYGAFFMKDFSNEVIDHSKFTSKLIELKKALNSKETSLRAIGVEIQKTNENISPLEGLLLSLTFRNKVLGINNSFFENLLVGHVSKDKMYNLAQNIGIYKKILTPSLILNQNNLNQGKRKGRGI